MTVGVHPPPPEQDLAALPAPDGQNSVGRDGGGAGLHFLPHYCHAAPYTTPQPVGRPLLYVTRSGTDVPVLAGRRRAPQMAWLWALSLPGTMWVDKDGGRTRRPLGQLPWQVGTQHTILLCREEAIP